MSDNFQVFIRLDPPDPIHCQAVCDELVAWLTLEQVVLDTGGELLPGPHANSVLHEPMSSRVAQSVTVDAEIVAATAAGNSEEWVCPRCAAELDWNDLVESWHTTHVEPIATCENCRFSALLGDWPAEFPTALIGAPCVAFQNWPPLQQRFVEELQHRLGGSRCRYFWEHL